MKAMILNSLKDLAKDRTPLQLKEISTPSPGDRELLIHVSTCCVCHTEIDEIEGRTPPPAFPIILGHQVVGTIVERGPGASTHEIGERVGVGWIGHACGNCKFCVTGNENLCDQFMATGRDLNGGYAEYMTISGDFAHKIPEKFSDIEAAPLLCAGAIGHRSLKLSNLKDGQILGLTGFGASGHLVLKLVQNQYPNATVFVFARSEKEREFAKHLGASWVGDMADRPPQQLDAVIDTTPAWKPVVEALSHLSPGGRLVINAIRKEDYDKEYLLKIQYPSHLWLEKEIKSVANVTREDIREFLEIAADMQIKPDIQEFELKDANQALWQLKNRIIRGAKVLRIS